MNQDFFRKNIWNIIILIIVLIIIVGAYVMISNSGNALDTYTPDEILDNPQEYHGEKIAIVGYYYQETYPQGQGVITTSTIPTGSSSTEIIKRLTIDHSSLNTTGLLADNIKYRFIGILSEQQGTFGETIDIFIVEKIEVV
jgi:hypothetical protein